MDAVKDPLVLPTLWIIAGCISFSLSAAIISIIATSKKLQVVLGPVLWMSLCDCIYMTKWVVSGVATLMYHPTHHGSGNATNHSSTTAPASPVVATTLVVMPFLEFENTAEVQENYYGAVLDQPEEDEMMHGLGPELCIFQTIAGQFGALGSVLWSVGILVNSWCLIKGFHQQLKNKIFVILHIVIWLSCVTTSVVPVITDSYGMVHIGSCWCNKGWMQASFFLFPAGAAIVTMLVLTGLAVYRTGHLPANAKSKRTLILRSFVAFVVISVIIWAVPLISHGMLWADPKLIFSAEWVRLEDTLMCLQGTLNFIVLMSIPEARAHLRSYWTSSHPSSPRSSARSSLNASSPRGPYIKMREYCDPALDEFEDEF